MRSCQNRQERFSWKGSSMTNTPSKATAANTAQEDSAWQSTIAVSKSYHAARANLPLPLPLWRSAASAPSAAKSQVSQSFYNLKDAAKMLNFLQANNIMDMAGLDEKFKSMIGEQLDIQGKLNPVERRLAVLKKHIEQADLYFKYKGKKKLTAERNALNQRYLALKEEVKEAEQIQKSVYSILRQEQREQAQHRAQDMER